MIEEIREEMKMLGDDRFAAWPEVCVSSKTGEGIENLKTIIVKNVLRTHHLRDTSGAFRMPIDRILSLPGRGTVIAGTILEGEVQPDDKIMLYPKKTEARIRSIQVHGQNAEKATAGQRAALLLPGIKKEELKRGNVAGSHSFSESVREAGCENYNVSSYRKNTETSEQITFAHRGRTSSVPCHFIWEK